MKVFDDVRCLSGWLPGKSHRRDSLEDIARAIPSREAGTDSAEVGKGGFVKGFSMSITGVFNVHNLRDAEI